MYCGKGLLRRKKARRFIEMTCKFCDRPGHTATVRLPGFDGKSMQASIEICDQDAELLRKVKQ